MRLLFGTAILLMTAVASGIVADNASAQVRRQDIRINNPTWIIPPRANWPVEEPGRGYRLVRAHLRCQLTVDGLFEDCEVIRISKPGPYFEREALAAMVRAEARPALFLGNPVQVTFQYELRIERPW